MAWLGACSDPTTPDDGVDQVRVIGDTALSLEPTEHRQLAAQCLNRSGRVLAPAECRVTWAVSDAAIATVSDGVLIAQREGSTVVTARRGDRTAEATVDVRWRAGARLSIGGLRDMEEGEAIRLQALVRESTTPVPGVTPQWNTSDPGVASIGADGLLTAVSTGSATISAQLAGLSTSATVTVTRVAPEGFGYVYLTEAYDLENFGGKVIPPATHAFTKSGTVEVAFEGNRNGFGPSYPSFSFGWMRGGYFAPVSSKPIAGLTLHAFSLDTATAEPCQAPRDSRTFGCLTRVERYGALEAVALTSAAFTGTAVSAAVEEPNKATGDPRVQVRAGAMPWQRQITVDGFTRRDLFWFVTPSDVYMVPRDGGFVPSTCVVAPSDATPSDIALSVHCTASTTATAIELNVTGFAAGAHRDGLPAVFAEVSATGSILRSSGHLLGVSAVRKSDRTTVVSLTGAALASFTRWPALLVTPVTTTDHARCAMAIRSSATAAALDVIVRCSEPNVGFMFGAVY